MVLDTDAVGQHVRCETGLIVKALARGAMNLMNSLGLATKERALTFRNASFAPSTNLPGCRDAYATYGVVFPVAVAKLQPRLWTVQALCRGLHLSRGLAESASGGPCQVYIQTR